MPLRDDRRGRRATLSPGSAPLRPEFNPLAKSVALAPSETTLDAVVNETAQREPANTPHEPAPLSDTASVDSASEAVRADIGRDAARANTASDVALADTGQVTRPNTAGESTHLESAGEERIDGASAAVPPAAIGPAHTTTDVAQTRIRLEPSAVLMAVARPFLAALRFARKPIVSASNDETTDSFSDLDSDSDSTAYAERSFANEVESLLRAPVEIDDRRADPLRNEESGPPLESSELRTQPMLQHEVAATEPPAHQNIVVESIPTRLERVVPLTRLPLRPQTLDITWTAGLPGIERNGSQARTARHQQLERYIREPGSISSDIIARAYREEDGDGRAIALRVLLRNFPQAGRAAFVEALRVGSDEERAIAIDGLSAIDARAELTVAFTDRVDAIAAKAALAYVGSLKRSDFTVELSAYIDEAQIRTILTLLAGIVE